MPQSVKDMIEQYVQQVKNIYGEHVKQIILYGSYARGDYHKESDVDIMVLVDLQEEQLEQHADALSELGFEYNITYGIWMMPIVKNIDHFRYWSQAYPFYSNVSQEGVMLYDAA